MNRDDLRLDIKFMMANNLIDRVSLQGELSEVIEKLKGLYVCQIEVGKDLIICKIKEEREV